MFLQHFLGVEEPTNKNDLMSVMIHDSMMDFGPPQGIWCFFYLFLFFSRLDHDNVVDTTFQEMPRENTSLLQVVVLKDCFFLPPETRGEMIQFDVLCWKEMGETPTTKKMSCFCNGALKILPLKTTSKKEPYAVPPQHTEENDPFWLPSVYCRGISDSQTIKLNQPTIVGWWIVWVIERITRAKTNMAMENPPFERCISYWTWGFSNVMLVFRGVYIYTHIITTHYCRFDFICQWNKDPGEP